MIIVDTLLNSTQCFIDKTEDVMVFKAGENAFVRLGSDEYIVSYNSGSFSQVKNKYKKHSAYKSDFSHYPFTETENFFTDLVKSLNNQSKISESDSIYLLFTSEKIIAFRKFDFSIKSITKSNFDRILKGFQFTQNLFGKVNTLDPSAEENIKNTLSIISDPGKKENNKIQETGPEFIDRYLLEKNLAPVVNGKVKSLMNKTVFLNFFYQGCFPCVKSYPYVNSLFNAADSSLIVIGVDQLPRDTLTIDKYIEKYNLQFPIIIGQPAAFLTQYFKLHSFPTFIVINPKGNVIKKVDGFTKGSFKKLMKKLLQ
jgi:hypothetical protein